MNLLRQGVLIAFFFHAASQVVTAAEETAPAELFAERVWPVLQAKCLGCHGEGTELEGGLDLRSREAMLKGGDTGPALVPGFPTQSSIYQAVLRTGDVVMPPKEANRLTTDEIAALKRWIQTGAKWPKGATETVATWSESSSEDTWAFQPRRRPDVPKIATADGRARHPIDAFILAKLNERGIEPAPPADPLTLLRRATFDLTGLPPTPVEVQGFLGNKTAYETLIDRLLASPRYGEQWGRHWLDVVRYADTAGFSNDFERPHAWRYRDYVIRSFNSDKPYDRFVAEQLAGDELDSTDPELLVATGFLRMGAWEHTAMSVAAVTRQLFLDDVTDSVGHTFLGLGLRCASCHDHKFDPIPTRDYYRLQAVFAPVQFEERPAAFLNAENTRGFEAARAVAQQRLSATQARLEKIQQKQEAAIDALLKEKGVRSVQDLPPAERPNRREFALSVEEMGLVKVYRKHAELQKLEAQRYDPVAFSVANGGLKKPTPTSDVFILAGGSLSSPGEKVTPGVLSAAHRPGNRSATSDEPVPDTTQGRRLALARWITDPVNPLTARVIVNRVWQYHFGRGLVETSNNFGKMGKRPTHPELLDWLAEEFIARGWSIKALHRLIMTSEAYRRGSEHPQPKILAERDPQNTLLAYFPPRRLTAEELRDSILAVSDELSDSSGGPGTFPEINLEAALQPRHVMGAMAPAYVPSKTREERNRRTIYTFQMRNLPNPMLEVFNAAGMEKSCERRDATTVTPQVFTLFNSQSVHDSALEFARRLERLAGDPTERVNHAYRLAFGREPTERERHACLTHVARMTEHHRRTPPERVEMPTSVVRTMVEELTGEPFTFTEQLDLTGYEPNLKPWDVSPEARAWAEMCLVLLNSNEFVYVY
jgi:hypothetical protein